MSFNGSFGEGEFVVEDDNSNILSLKTEDFKMNYEENYNEGIAGKSEIYSDRCAL